MEQIKDNPLSTIIKDGGFTGIFRTIACIGDSLSSGEHESLDENGVRGYHDYYEYSWGQYIARKCGSKVVNYSCGGLTAKEFHSLADHMKCFTPENACQAYIVALGVNDGSRIMNGSLEFGSMEDVDFSNWRNNKSTFVGEYVKILQRICELQPKARIFVMTAPKAEWSSEESTAMGDKMAEFLRTLPDYFEFLYVIDLRKYEKPHDEEFRKRYYCSSHLNAMGYMLSADVISTYIDYIIRTNYEDFKQVAFIGKDVHNCSVKW